MISLMVFLGNPGPQYSGNRHNVAWQFADSLDLTKSLMWREKFRGHFASYGGRNLWFLKPGTFMNLSGESAGELARFYKITPAEILVVQDELELPLGTVSLKWSGGLGGHNGLRSMEAVFGVRDFWRLRFGIGRPEHPDIYGYVLSDFPAAEQERLRFVFQQTAALFTALLTQEPELFLAEWGKKKITTPS
ncbi:MAG: aminoacyl-tRNA hydrolase [Treponema sp.]|jgi:PTH1 family peptidyl-tRNA hydrolase|nr:aminoacyl-tRNA hydrolase [Treponema sp.]